MAKVWNADTLKLEDDIEPARQEWLTKNAKPDASEWIWEKDLGTPHPSPDDTHCGAYSKSWDIHTSEIATGTVETQKETLSEAATILHDAAALIDGDRHEQHGDRHENFDTIAQMWSAWLGIKLSPASVAWMMVLVKVARAANGEKNKDNSTDAAGYASLAWELTDAGC